LPIATTCAAGFVTGASVTVRQCSIKAAYDFDGCQSREFPPYTGSSDICTCSEDMCNEAMMTSSVGHVIMAVALLVGVVFGRLM